MNERQRDYFDRQAKWVFDHLPREIRLLLEEIPVDIEDYPSRKIMQQLGLQYIDDLCGLYTGFTREQRYHVSGVIPHRIKLYREGLVSAVLRAAGSMNRDELRKQIKITLLHEIGHYYGMSEKQLQELGYG